MRCQGFESFFENFFVQLFLGSLNYNLVDELEWEFKAVKVVGSSCQISAKLPSSITLLNLTVPHLFAHPVMHTTQDIPEKWTW